MTMTNSFKARLLQHLVKKSNKNKGFTLIELLVVIIIIGILSAVALPQFLSQSKKARVAEAKSIVGSVIRGQQAYKLEKGNWTTSCTDLSVDVPQDDQTNFNYVCGDQTDANTAIVVTAAGKASDSAYKDLKVTGTFDPATGSVTIEGEDTATGDKL
jgi:type IV pilus assembly protein PilA